MWLLLKIELQEISSLFLYTPVIKLKNIIKYLSIKKNLDIKIFQMSNALIVIPAFNEELTIEKSCSEFQKIWKSISCE